MPCGAKVRVKVTELKYVVLCRFIKLLDTRVELARLASNKQQQASNNKQATSPIGLFLVRRADAAEKSKKKNVTTLSGIIFRNFLGNKFFSGRTSTGRKR